MFKNMKMQLKLALLKYYVSGDVWSRDVNCEVREGFILL